MTSFSTPTFVIEDLTYIPTGTYQPMFTRPYLVNATQSAVETISNRLEDTKSSKITPNILGDVTSEIIQPSAVGMETLINNDWIDTKKFIFVLKVSYVGPTGEKRINYLQGYTNYDGITNSGNIDTELLHTVNSVIETVAVTYNTPLGIEEKETLYSIYNILSNGGYEEVYSQRPVDIIGYLDTAPLSQILSGANEGIESYYVGSLMTSFDQKLNTSNMSNNIPTNYLSKILTTSKQNRDLTSLVLGDSELTTSEGSSIINERAVSDNKFLHTVSKLEGFRQTRNTFSFKTIMGLDPTIYNRFKVLNITKNILSPEGLNTPEVGDFWNGQDIVTLKAYSLIESSVSLATKYGFNKLHFTASNMSDPTGASNIFITNFNSFINLGERDFNSLMEIFKDKFITDIFISETNGGVIPTYMEMYVDLLGTSKIYLSYAGYPSTWYTIPTFANSLFAPVVIADKNTLDYSVESFNFMLSNIETGPNIQETNFFY